MLTDGTTHAVAVLESVDPGRHGELGAAVGDLADRVESLLGATVARRAILTKGQPAVSLEAT